MTKGRKISTEQREKHDEAMTRIRDATKARTQVELAAVLGIRQSSISDADRRASIPAEWLITLLRKYGILPDFILEGVGPSSLSTYGPSSVDFVKLEIRALQEKLQKMDVRFRTAVETAELTAQGFLLRKDAAAEELTKARETIAELQGRVRDLVAELNNANSTL